MGDAIDDFVDRLQEEIFSETREAFGEAGFERWRHPRFQGPLADADACARLTGTCGDSMAIFLNFAENRVCDAAYMTDGCGSSTVCGSFCAELALGRTPDELLDITGEAILEKIGRFPKEDRHCAFLAAEALQEALSQYMVAHAARKGDG